VSYTGAVPHTTSRTALQRGWSPGLLGDVVALQARYYADAWGFGSFFEAKLAREMAEFAGRYDPKQDLILSTADRDRTTGSVTIDGSDPAASEGLVHLRWFILGEGSRGRGIGRALIEESLAFARSLQRPGVYLWTFAGLDAARRLYDDAGFRLVQEQVGDTWGTRVTEQRFVLEFDRRPPP
jgi:GNAT superfamily N-acetyltransferase